MNTKKLYITPSIEVISIDACDIIAASPFIPTDDDIFIPIDSDPEPDPIGFGD